MAARIALLRRPFSLLGAAGLAVLGVLLMGELAVRFTVEHVLVNDYQWADVVLGFRNPQVRMPCRDERGSYEFRATTFGNRGAEPPAADEPKQEGVERILLLGDSFLVAWGVREEEWVGTVLQREMERAGKPAEVYALGAADYGTGQELLALRRSGARIRPDRVVLLIFTNNDLINNTIELAGRSPVSSSDFFRPYFVPDASGELTVRFLSPWRSRLRRSQLFRVLEQRWLARHTFAEIAEWIAGEPLLDNLARVAAGRLPEEHFEIFCPPEPASRWAVAWERTEALVRATRAEAESLGARFSVVVIPGLQQVEYGIGMMQFERMVQDANVPRWQTLDLARPERRLDEFFHREGIPHVETLAPLRDHVEQTRATVYQRNYHLNGEGHGVMGRALAENLLHGTNVCAPGTGGPLPVLDFYDEPPLALDFQTREHWILFGAGWADWPSSGPHGGWGMTGVGSLALRPGRVTLRGRLPEGAPTPIELRLVLDHGPRVSTKTLAAAGPFEWTFPLRPARDGLGWRPLFLSALGPEGASPPAGPKLFLEGLAIDPLAR